MGPDYVSKEDRPEATVSTVVKFPNVHTLPQTPQLIALLTWVVHNLPVTICDTLI